MLINHKEYYSKYFKYYLIGLGIMLISNSIIVYGFDGGISTNEETIRDIFKISPLYIYFSSVIYAPIVEELTFRQGIRNIFGRNILFVLISGFLFGGLHVITSINSIVDLLYIIPYSSLGIVFAYILYKTDNIFVSMGLHFMHNGILIAIQFLVLIFS
jgi:membrane protease YdiL (CAAX protease family)